MTRHTDEARAMRIVQSYIDHFGPVWCLAQFRRAEGPMAETVPVDLYNVRKTLTKHREWLEQQSNGDNNGTDEND